MHVHARHLCSSHSFFPLLSSLCSLWGGELLREKKMMAVRSRFGLTVYTSGGQKSLQWNDECNRGLLRLHRCNLCSVKPFMCRWKDLCTAHPRLWYTINFFLYFQLFFVLFVFFTRSDSRPGLYWQPRLSAAITSSQAAAHNKERWLHSNP